MLPAWLLRFQIDLAEMKHDLGLSDFDSAQTVHDACRAGISTWTGTDAP